MAVASKLIRELLENGAHFGHQTNKWNPKMEKYIFGQKSGIYIIDLRKTEKALLEAKAFLEDLAASGKKVLFVGTKKQAKKLVKKAAMDCDMFYVDERWLGGCLTNFSTIRRSVDKLNQIQEKKKSEIYDSFAKKEKARIDREENKLLKNLAGIRDMDKLPDCLVVIDSEAEDISVKEAKIIGAPVVAMLDTNCDPDPIDFPIPANDDAIRSIQFVLQQLSEAVEKGNKKFNGVKEFIKDKKEEDKAPEVEEVEAEEIIVEEKQEKNPEQEKIEIVEKAKEEPETEEPEKEETPADEEIAVDESGDIKLGDTDK